jgi:hypothetical protein
VLLPRARIGHEATEHVVTRLQGDCIVAERPGPMRAIPPRYSPTSIRHRM